MCMKLREFIRAANEIAFKFKKKLHDLCNQKYTCPIKILFSSFYDFLIGNILNAQNFLIGTKLNVH